MTSRESAIFRLFSARTGTDFEPAAELPMLVTPGDVITNDADYMRLKIKCISLKYWPCIHVGNPTAKIEYFPSGTRACKQRGTNCVLLRKQTFRSSAGPRFAVIGLL